MSGSRVILTTRNTNVAHYVSRDVDLTFALGGLDDNESWNLLRTKIFGKDDCPPVLEDIGKKIARRCRGLPLSLVAMAGVLSKSNMTTSYWEDILKNMSGRTLSSKDEQHSLKVLSLSYHELPVNLKSCLLYFRNFHEDAKIEVKDLIREWIAEGYVKPVASKTLEEVAEEQLEDLGGRNIVLILRRNLIGKIKECGVHDLVLELCIRESAKENFRSVPRLMMPWVKENKTCFVCFYYIKKDEGERICMQQIEEAIPTPLADILVCKQCRTKYPFLEKLLLVNFLNKKLLTTLRFIDCSSNLDQVQPPTMLYFWNLQFLILKLDPADLEENDLEFLGMIWDMPQLRYVDISYVPLPEPVTSSSSYPILSELQKLSACDLRVSNELIGRIPNIKRLKLRHSYYSEDSDWCLDLLLFFCHLESVSIDGFYDLLEYKIQLPHCLRKLTLNYVKICWDETMTIVGSLPNLQVLKLINVWDERTTTSEWNMKEGGFPSLELLVLRHTEPEIWSGDCDHLPRLKSLVIESVKNLEIPLDFGDIPCLDSIHLNGCGERTCISARKIRQTQRDYGSEFELYVNGKLQSDDP